MNISAIILTKNEEESLKACVESVRFCDEIIVIDDYSRDKTIKIAKKLNLKVFKRKLSNDFASQRNFGSKKAKSEWVLFIDADERVSPSLAKELKKTKSAKGINGFYIKRRDFIWGRELRYGEAGSIKLLRFAKRETGVWKRKIHEYWDVKGKTGDLSNPLYHYPHQKLSEFIKDINWMSSIHSEENQKERKGSSLLKIIVWPNGKFIDNFIVKGGLLDNMPGFTLALMMSFHSFLSWSKQWLNQKRIN